ncbi:MAG: copper resistance CopC family protein [Pseudonocardiaceae bacterium]
MHQRIDTALAARPGARLRQLPALLALVGLALLGSTGLASAHNELIGSDPPEGAELATAPARVVLTFDKPVQRGFSAVTVTGPGSAPDNATQWQDGTATEDGAAVSAPVRPLGPAGQYTIAYQVLSADGHPVRGALHFTLTRPGPGIAAAGKEPGESANRSAVAVEGTATQSQPGGTAVWPWVAGGGALLAAGVVVATRVRRSS